MKRKGICIMTAAFCLTSLIGLLFSSCHKGTEEDLPVSGGRTVLTDPNAPKTVRSKELTGFSADLYLDNRWSGDEEHEFAFSVAPDESGALQASEEHAGIRLPADHALCGALADVIAEYDLAAMNGLYDVTAGLPPEFAAHTFEAAYASGETISFTVNNDPVSPWGEAVYDVFAYWFAEHGDETLYPARESSPLVRFSLTVIDGEKETWYDEITVGEEDAIDGETTLLARESSESPGGNERKLVRFPADYYEKLAAVLSASGLERKYEFSRYDPAAGDYGNHDAGYYGWSGLTAADGEEDDENRALFLYLEYESGYSIVIDTRKPSEIDAMQPLLDALTAYLDPLFR